MKNFIRRNFLTPDDKQATLIMGVGDVRLQSLMYIMDESDEIIFTDMLFTHDGVLYKAEGETFEAMMQSFIDRSTDKVNAENLILNISMEINHALSELSNVKQ